MVPSEWKQPETGMSYQEWEERRKFKRYLSDITVRFNRLSDGTDAGGGLVINISRGGVFVRTPHSVPVGTELKMTITVVTPFGEQQDIPSEVRVVWVCTRPGEEGMGLTFTKVDRHSQYAMLASAYRGHD